MNELIALASAVVKENGKPALPTELRTLERVVDGVRIVVSDVRLQGVIPRGNISVALPARVVDVGDGAYERPAIEVGLTDVPLGYPQMVYGSLNRRITQQGHPRENGTLSNAVSAALAPYQGLIILFEGSDYATYRW